MNAVLVYGESASARKANALLQRASDRADAATQWSVKPWRLDLLNWPGFAEDALQDAAEAHLILLAVSDHTELPAGLLTWLEGWAARRLVQDAALAVFNDGKGDTLSPTATPALSAFAERHGLSLIFGNVAPAEDVSAMLRRELHEREVTQTETLTLILEQAGPNHTAAWRRNQV